MIKEEKIENKPSLKAQSIWLLFAKLVGFGLNFLLPILIYRTLSRSEIGIYNQVFLVVVTISGILPFGVSMSAFYYLSREPEKRRFFIFNILLFNFIVGGMACLFLNLYPQVLFNIFKDAEMTQYAPRIGLVIWLWVFSTFLEMVAVANQETRVATFFIISAQFTKAVFMLSAVYFYGTVEAILNAAMIQAIIQTAVLMLYLNSRFKGFWHSFDKELLIQHLKYALPFGLMGVLWTLQSEIHNYFIGYGFSSEEMAIYRVGCFEIPLLYLLQESVSSVMIPRMSQLQAEDNKREMIEFTARATEKLALVYFPTFVFLMITAYTLITTLFTTKFADSVPIFVTNIILLPFAVFIADPITRAYESIGKYILKIRIFIVIGLLLTLYYGINHFDLQGMVLIVVVTALIDRMASTIKIWKTVEIKFSDIFLLKNVGKIGLMSLAAGLPTFFVYQQIRQFAPGWAQKLSEMIFTAPKETLVETLGGMLTLGLTGIFFGLLYLSGIYFFGIIANEEKEFIRNKLTGFGKYLGIAQSSS
jgi:O-antigen/teichoic acid export membrane protein